MTDFLKMRRNMLDCQIRTAGVINEGVLHAFETVPREQFVPENLRAVSYNDEDIHIGAHRFLLEPMVQAKLLQALDLQPHEVVLDIGSGSGYSAAVISLLASTVISLIEKPEFLQVSQQRWRDMDYCNIVGVAGHLTQGHPEHAPYDAIYINGAVAAVPQAILNQLGVNGRLACVLKASPSAMGRAVIIQRLGDHHFSTQELFDAGTPYLHGFAPEPAFQF